jgi:hypothetical protein
VFLPSSCAGSVASTHTPAQPHSHIALPPSLPSPSPPSSSLLHLTSIEAVSCLSTSSFLVAHVKLMAYTHIRQLHIHEKENNKSEEVLFVCFGKAVCHSSRMCRSRAFRSSRPQEDVRSLAVPETSSLLPYFFIVISVFHAHICYSPSFFACLLIPLPPPPPPLLCPTQTH